MILGDTCTRACAFCNVKTGKPSEPPDPMEPLNVAKSVLKLGLRHVVVTSVDRDDLPDGGAQHFIDTIKYIRELSNNTTIEILTPDFLRKNRNYIDIAKDELSFVNNISEIEYEQNFNVAPQNQAPCIIDNNLVIANWGYFPDWLKSQSNPRPLFNTRYESLLEKKTIYFSI